LVSAGPSLFFAWSIFGEPEQLLAIGCALTLFIVAFAAFECGPYYNKLRDIPYVVTAVRVGYIARIGASILFPVGMSLDLVTGFFSLGLTSILFPQIMPGDDGSVERGFLPILVASLIHGVLLNAVVFGVIVAAYGAVRAVNRGIGPSKSTLASVERRNGDGDL
jgi:hypothetical protein